MFRRAKSQSTQAPPRPSHEPIDDEVARLRAQVVRLERALLYVLDVPNDELEELRGLEAVQSAGQSSFADAWKQPEPAIDDADQFFAVGGGDQRARKWLLTKK